MTKKKLLIIFNPRAGRNENRPDVNYIRKTLESHDFDVDVKLTVCKGDAEELAYIYAKKYDVLTVCGGDGTLSEAINGVVRSGSDVPVGYIPTGSTNDLAATVGIPTDVNKAVELIASGNVNTYDSASFNSGGFSYIACFGPGTHISYSTPQRMKNALGYSAYTLNGFLFNVIPTVLEAKPKHIKIEYDGETLDDYFYFGAVSNALSVARMFNFDRNKVRLNDGKYEIMLVRKIHDVAGLIDTVFKLLRGDLDCDSLLFLTASEVKFEFDSPVNWITDGEFGGKIRKADIRIKKHAVRLLCPDSELFIKQ